MPITAQDLYLMGRNDQALAAFRQEFDRLRNALNEHGDPEVLKVHKCNRASTCECIVPCQLLINLCERMGLDAAPVLNRFFYKPEIFLPYPSFLYWCSSVSYLGSSTKFIGNSTRRWRTSSRSSSITAPSSWTARGSNPLTIVMRMTLFRAPAVRIRLNHLQGRVQPNHPL